MRNRISKYFNKYLCNECNKNLLTSKDLIFVETKKKIYDFCSYECADKFLSRKKSKRNFIEKGV